ncbi:MAG: hypothetical protein R3E39_15795 [Anaerolineae bacterium]
MLMEVFRARIGKATLLSIGSILLLSLAMVLPVLAGTGSYSGTNVGGGSWARPFADGTCCSGLGPVLYHSQPFYVGTSGNYDVSSVQSGWDGYIFIYRNSFDPTNQSTNFVAGDDDGIGGIGTSNIDAVALTAGTTYFLVTTGFANGDEGTFTNTITGPGTVTIGTPAPITVAGPPGSDLFLPNDNRINHNAWDRAAPVAIYCQDDYQRILVWKIDFSTGHGYSGPTINISYAEAEAKGVPTGKNLLLAEADGVQLWRLTTGEFQVNTRYPTEYKDWSFVWNKCYPDITYSINR